jgi:hypothetical protein
MLLVPGALWAVAPEPSPSPSPQAPRPALRERLRKPLGSPHEMARRPPDDTLLHFEERVNVVVPSLDLVRLRAEWTRHWNLSGHEGEASGPPTVPDMRDRWQYLAALSGHPVPQSLPLQDLLIGAGRALAERLTRKAMPPAGPPAPPSPKPAPLQVHVEESATEPSGVSSAAESEPQPSPSPEIPEITTIVGGRRAHE